MIVGALLCCAVAAAAEVPVPPRLARLRAAELAGFWREVTRRGTPLIDPVAGRPDLMDVTFLWRGSADAVAPRVFGVFNTHPWTDGDAMHHLPGTDVWFLRYRLPAGLRASYHLLGPRTAFPRLRFQRVWEGERRHDLLLDPLNPRKIADVYFRRLSYDNVFAGPRAPQWYDGGRLRGRVVALVLRPSRSQPPRRVLVYLPPVRHDAAPPGVLLLFDGLSYRTPGMVPEMLDRMIAAKQIPPTSAVMFDSGPIERRETELNADPAFERFVVKRLLPLVQARFHLTRDPRRTIVAGASRGGLAAASIALRYPETFGNVIAQSAAFWSAPDRRDHHKDWMARQYLAVPTTVPVRFHIAPGTMEDAEDMLEPNRRFRDRLRARGYRICFREFVGGHSFVNWRDDLAVAIREMTRPWHTADPCEKSDVSAGKRAGDAATAAH